MSIYVVQGEAAWERLDVEGIPDALPDQLGRTCVLIPTSLTRPRVVTDSPQEMVALSNRFGFSPYDRVRVRRHDRFASGWVYGEPGIEGLMRLWVTGTVLATVWDPPLVQAHDVS